MRKKSILLMAILSILAIILTGCAVPFLNWRPMMEAIGNKQVIVGHAVAFTVEASDPDGDVLKIEVYPKQFSQYFDAKTRTFTWTPTEENVGANVLTVIVTDGQATISQNVTITVTNIQNQSPILNPIPNKEVTEGQTLRFVVTAADPDEDDSLQLTASGELSKYFDPVSGVFNWPTKIGDAGEYHVTFIVSDGHIAVSKDVVINVQAYVNYLPEITAIADQAVNEGEQVGPIELKATDANNDPLTWEIISGPGQLINGHYYIWSPTYSSSGLHLVTLRVADGQGGTALTTFKINVANVNRSPVMTLKKADGTVITNAITFSVGQNNEFYVEATDPDGDTLTYTLEDWYTTEETLLDLKSHFTVDVESRKGIFSWAPLPGDERVYSLTFKVTDPNGASDMESVVINVQ